VTILKLFQNNPLPPTRGKEAGRFYLRKYDCSFCQHKKNQKRPGEIKGVRYKVVGNVLDKTHLSHPRNSASLPQTGLGVIVLFVGAKRTKNALAK